MPPEGPELSDSHPPVRHVFERSVPLEEVRGTLRLAPLALESLHGEDRVRLEAGYTFDVPRRICDIDAGTPAGRDSSCLFAGFVRREFGPGSFRVERIGPAAPSGAGAGDGGRRGK